MELEFDRDTLTYWETVAEVTLCQEETLETIVPDACPDILRIVDVCGQAMLTGKQAKEGAAQVTGLVRAAILYQPEGAPGLGRMEVGLPFTCQAEAPGLTDRGQVQASPRLRQAEARVLNPRKVLLRVDLAIEITACQPVDRPVCRGVLEGEEGSVCQRRYQGETYQLSALEEKPFTFQQQVRLPALQGEGGRLLAMRARPVCTESRLIGSKLILKGTTELDLLAGDDAGALSASHESMPFSQIMEVPGVGEEGECQVTVELTDLSCQSEGSDERQLEVTLELLAQAQVCCRRPVTLLQDLYSTSHLTEVDGEVLPLRQLEERSVRPQGVRELLETGETVRGVADSRLALGQVKQSREGEQLVLSAEVWVTVLYLDQEEQVRCARRTVNVDCRLDCPQDCRCTCTVQCPGEIFAAPAAGGVEVRFTLEFACLVTRQVAVPVVKGARLGEARGAGQGPRPSVVLRLAAPGEGVWDIAKAYGTTKEEILQANELEEEMLPPGKMLLIPSVRG